MIITSKRLNKTDKSDLRAIYIDDELFCVSIEHPMRDAKIEGITGINCGMYEVKQREEMTPLTQKYLNKYGWFEWHLQIMDIDNFTDVYLHVGNSVDDSLACPLIGQMKFGNNDYILSSTDTFKAFYLRVTSALNAGERVWFHKVS